MVLGLDSSVLLYGREKHIYMLSIERALETYMYAKYANYIKNQKYLQVLVSKKICTNMQLKICNKNVCIF